MSSNTEDRIKDIDFRIGELKGVEDRLIAMGGKLDKRLAEGIVYEEHDLQQELHMNNVHLDRIAEELYELYMEKEELSKDNK